MLVSTDSHLHRRYRVSFLDNWPEHLMQRSQMTRFVRGYPSSCLPSVCFSVSRFALFSVCLTQLIIQMSTARSLPSKGVAGMFSTVPFLFVMWNQSPQTQWRYPRLTPRTAALPIKERSTTAASERLAVDHQMKKKKKVILITIILIISFVTVALCLPPFLPCGAITTSPWQPRNNQHNHYYHNHHHHHCHRRLMSCLSSEAPAGCRTGITLRGRT